MTLSREYEGSLCEVKTMRNELITAGRVNWVEKDQVEIINPTATMPIINCKTPVKIGIFNSALGFKMMAGEVLSSDGEAMRLADVMVFVEYERRRFFRLDTDASCVLLRQMVDGSGRPMGRPEQIPGRVKNLSLCGAMFETSRLFDADDQVTLRMALYKNRMQNLKTIIRRRQEVEEGRYSYSVEIVELGREAEQDLCAYLFEQQRQKLEKKKTL